MFQPHSTSTFNPKIKNLRSHETKEIVITFYISYESTVIGTNYLGDNR